MTKKPIFMELQLILFKSTFSELHFSSIELKLTFFNLHFSICDQEIRLKGNNNQFNLKFTISQAQSLDAFH